ncbi:hypothetical protein [Amycolatopsis magusensis]|uniref:hypothetical protein n=1 Tax=Amycolatopsis magusensis TaxID=882444 RepID=UPI0037B2933F
MSETRQTAAPEEDRTWERVREELGQRLLARIDLDDRDRPAAQVLRARAAKLAAYLVVDLENTLEPTGWWSAFWRRRLVNRAQRALRRARTVQYPEMMELVNATARGYRDFLRCFEADQEAYRSDPQAWLEQHSPWRGTGTPKRPEPADASDRTAR